MSKKILHGGQYVGIRHDGTPVPLGADSQGRAPDLWICRRVADYGYGQIPGAAAFTVCTSCGAEIAYNPACTVDAPKVCMQCANIEPLAIK